MKTRYFLFFCFLFAITFSGCKKTIDNIKEDLMINLITSNTWKIVRYVDSTRNKTSLFTNYDFKFGKDGKVNALMNGEVKATGTWVGSESSQSITSEFAGEGEPLSRLTGIWLITNTKSKPWRVYSHRFEGATEFILDLEAE